MLPCGYMCVDDTINVEKNGNMGGKCMSVNDIGESVIPEAPSEDGEYDLKVTVSSGVPTYSWEASAKEYEKLYRELLK